MRTNFLTIQFASGFIEIPTRGSAGGLRQLDSAAARSSFFHSHHNKRLRRRALESGEGQPGGLGRSRDPPPARSHEVIKLPGSVITLLWRIDMAGAAEQAVIAESPCAFFVIVEGIKEKDGACALIESGQGTPVSGKAEVLPLVFKSLVLIVQIPILGEPHRDLRILAGFYALDLRTHGIVSIGVEGEHPYLLHQFAVFQYGIGVIIR